jgi:hypothetical protein
MVAGLAARGTSATVIGEVVAAGVREVVSSDGRVESVEDLPRDELYRILESL